MKSGESFVQFKRRVREELEIYLDKTFAQSGDSEVCRVARYAVLGGGHRWRGMVAIAAGQIFHHDAFRICLSGAAAAELAHAASLILDDLPSMDNAQIRRGKTCPHHVFPRWAVDLAPEFLVNLAYSLILSNSLVSYERRIRAGIEVSHAGLQMIAGQERDMVPDRQDVESLLECYRLKSGALYAAAAKAGALFAGAAAEDADLLHECGLNLGLSYQFLDDVADVVATVQEVGKQSGMDKEKCTAIRLFGPDKVHNQAKRYEAQALAALERFGAEAEDLRMIVSHASWAPV